MTKLTWWPDVYIDYKAKAKLDLYTKHAPGEISGFGDVEITPSGNLRITDVYILEQESSQGGTEIFDDIIADFIKQAIEDGKDLKKVRLWWHSHANIGAFWSGTDEKTSRQTLSQAPFFISIVTNKNGDYLVKINMYLNGGDGLPVEIDDVPLQVIYPEIEGLDDQISAEVNDKVKSPVKTITVWCEHECSYPNCTSKVYNADEDMCWDHRPPKEGQSICAYRDCKNKFWMEYDKENTGFCTTHRFKTKDNHDKDPLKGKDGEDFSHEEVAIEIAVKEFGPTYADAVAIEYEGEGYVTEWDSKGNIIGKYELRNNAPLWNYVYETVYDKDGTAYLGERCHACYNFIDDDNRSYLLPDLCNECCSVVDG